MSGLGALSQFLILIKIAYIVVSSSVENSFLAKNYREILSEKSQSREKVFNIFLHKFSTATISFQHWLSDLFIIYS